jgi:ATP-dependent DNA ligase
VDIDWQFELDCRSKQKVNRMMADDGSVFLYAFDLIELNGDDLRREPLEVRKATLASVVAKAAPTSA